MEQNSEDIQADVATVSRLTVVPAILQMICHTTGMGFAALARVTSQQWVAMQVQDNIKFGLMPGGELKVDTTICHEIRQSGQPVIIDHVDKDEFYRKHHTPAMYGFQSYISIPVPRHDGSFYGTLCAIDPNPAVLTIPEVLNMFRAFAAIISFHLNAADQLPVPKAQLLADRTTTYLNDEFRKITGHDLHADTATPTDVLSASKRHTNQYTIAMQHLTSRLHHLLNELKAEA